ncbi:MAG: DUF61 family protein [Syntrophales bacterium]|nr:DUF61 family protein [Syntrophales bacterium]
MPIDDKKITDTHISVYLENEFKAINAHIPRNRKTLTQLLQETRPQIDLSDGSTHFFRKKELEYIAEIINEEERNFLMLPMLMEVSSEMSDIKVRSSRGIEAKILSKVLDMDVAYDQKNVTVYRRQLGQIRKILATSTQYVFTP